MSMYGTLLHPARDDSRYLDRGGSNDGAALDSQHPIQPSEGKEQAAKKANQRKNKFGESHS